MSTHPDRAAASDAPERTSSRREISGINCITDGSCFRDAKLLTAALPDTSAAHLPGATRANDAITFHPRFDAETLKRLGASEPESGRPANDVAVIADKSATMAQKAAAAQHLFEHSPKDANGRVSFKVKEGENEREYSISSVRAGAKTNVSAIFTKDAQGAEHPVLRWVERNGRIEHQLGPHGKVDFRSNYAAEKMSDSSVTHTGQSTQSEHHPLQSKFTRTEREGMRPERAQPEKAQRHQTEHERMKPDHERTKPEHERTKPDHPRRQRPEQGEPGRPSSKYDRYGATPEERREHTTAERTEVRSAGATRPASDWNHFFRAQTRGNNCLPAAMSMMYSDWAKGSPANNNELSQIERVTHVGRSGPYTGSATDIGKQAESVIPGFKTEAFQGLNRSSLGAELDKQLGQGHTVIAGIKSPYSSNNHYIYVAGKDDRGNYLIGDSGRQGGGILGKTIGREDLLNRMMARQGGSRMVAGHTDAATPATNIEGTAASRYAHLDSSAPRPAEKAERTQPAEPRIERRAEPPAERHAERQAERQPASGSDRVVHRLKNAIVDVPKDLDPSKPIHFLTHFNGWKSSFEHAHRSGQLSEQMRNAPPNTVLISARWQDTQFSKNSSLDEFAARNGLRSTLSEAFRSVPELGRTGLNAGDTLGLSAFSAGYNAVDNVLTDKALANRVTKIVMFDSPSSDVRQFVYSHLRDFAEGKRQLNVVSGDWRARDYHGFSDELAKKFREAGANPNDFMYDGRRSPDHPDMQAAKSKGLSFIYTRTNHSNIPGRWFAAGAF